MPGHIVMMLNLKGGVAKTANCVAIAERFAEEGKRVCVIDADHQCMASELLVGQPRMLQADIRRRTLHDMMARMLDDDFDRSMIDAYVLREGVSNIGNGYPNLSLIPCSVRIDDFLSAIAKAQKGYATREDFLSSWSKHRRALQAYFRQQFDVTLVDCPPSLTVQVQQFLSMADGIITPSIPDALSVRGSLWLMDRIRLMGFKRVKALGILWSLYRQQVDKHRLTVKRASEGVYPFDQLPRPFETMLPNSSAMANAMEPDQKFERYGHKYSDDVAQRYARLVEEIEERISACAVLSAAS